MSKVKDIRKKYIDAIFEEQLLNDDPKNDESNTSWLESLSLDELRDRLGRMLEDDDFPELDDNEELYGDESELDGEIRDIPEIDE